MVETFSLGNERLNAKKLVNLAKQANPPLKVEKTCWSSLEAQRHILEKAIQNQETIYGVNTGFGFLSQVRIPQEQIEELQVNLIRSHACGVGEKLQDEDVRALLILKAHNFLQGHSGVTEKCVKHILEFLRYDILPMIPSKGSVGASGDLAPLAHLALALIGEGTASFQSEDFPSSELLKRFDLSAYIPQMKEGLALINGTHFMSVEGSFALVEAKRLISLADIALALSLTGLQGTASAFDPRIHKLRPHQGQVDSASHILSLLAKEELLSQYTKVQDPYSFRCAAQVHGIARMTSDFVDGILETELNSITDNPLVFSNGDVLSGGNFHGAPLACSFDYLSIALTDLGNISERRIEKLTNPSMSGLPAFLTKNGGLNSGFMIPQVVAAALASENKVLSHPASVDTIPTSADKEDHVSMGAFGSRKLRTITKNLASILAIELLTACQAIDLVNAKLSPELKVIYDKIRSNSPRVEADRSLHLDIENLARDILNGEFLESFSSGD